MSDILESYDPEYLNEVGVRLAGSDADPADALEGSDERVVASDTGVFDLSTIDVTGATVFFQGADLLFRLPDGGVVRVLDFFTSANGGPGSLKLADDAMVPRLLSYVVSDGVPYLRALTNESVDTDRITVKEPELAARVVLEPVTSVAADGLVDSSRSASSKRPVSAAVEAGPLGSGFELSREVPDLEFGSGESSGGGNILGDRDPLDEGREAGLAGTGAVAVSPEPVAIVVPAPLQPRKKVSDPPGVTEPVLPDQDWSSDEVTLAFSGDNLVIYPVDPQSGAAASVLFWGAEETVRVRWYDQSGSGLSGDGNEARFPGLEITRFVVFDRRGLGGSSVTEGVEVASGVWEADVTLGESVFAPGDQLRQFSAQVMAVAPDGKTFTSREALVSRFLLADDIDNDLEGTLEDDVFLMPHNAFDYQKILDGGSGTDVVVYGDSADSLHFDGNMVSAPGGGLAHILHNIEGLFVDADVSITVADGTGSHWVVDSESGHSRLLLDFEGTEAFGHFVQFDALLSEARQDEALVLL